MNETRPLGESRRRAAGAPAVAAAGLVEGAGRLDERPLDGRLVMQSGERRGRIDDGDVEVGRRVGAVLEGIRRALGRRVGVITVIGVIVADQPADEPAVMIVIVMVVVDEVRAGQDDEDLRPDQHEQGRATATEAG